MPRQRGQRLNFNFTKGWNTEASPLTFPEGTSMDLDNVVLDIDGSVRRRGGIDYDKQSTSFGSTASGFLSTYAINLSVWDNVGGDGSLKFLVTQNGENLYFHQSAGVNTLDNLIDTLDFSSFSTDSANSKKSVVRVASGLGYLFVTGEYIDPFYVTYDSGAGTVSATAIMVKIRDFDGVDDSLDVNERPTTLSDSHDYNLRNQGWVQSYQLNSGFDGDPVDYTFTEMGYYPSNSDVMYFGKVTSATDPLDLGEYSPSVMDKNIFGTTPASKGRFILDAFNKDRGAASGISITTETTTSRPKAIAFHNGRVFYAGLTDAGKTGEVYYSQQLTDISNVGKCYQEQDPTAEVFNSLLATDGGLLIIPDAGEILRMEEYANGVVLFATNGVWQITGENGRFAADNFFIKKVSEIGCIAGGSVVEADGIWMYWSESGIVALKGDDVSGNLVADIITRTTIQTGYSAIPSANKRFVRGAFIKDEKKVFWLYSTNDSFDGVSDRFKYNNVLVLDTSLSAFYKYSITDIVDGEPPYAAGIAEMATSVSATVAEVVTANGTDVTAVGVDVTVSGSGYGTETDVYSSFKILAVRPVDGTNDGFTFAEFRSATFTDWYYYDGVGADYTSYLETGYDHGGEPHLEKRPTYVYTYMSKESKSDFPSLPAYE